MPLNYTAIMAGWQGHFRNFIGIHRIFRKFFCWQRQFSPNFAKTYGFLFGKTGKKLQDNHFLDTHAGFKHALHTLRLIWNKNYNVKALYNAICRSKVAIQSWQRFWCKWSFICVTLGSPFGRAGTPKAWLRGERWPSPPRHSPGHLSQRERQGRC